MIEKTNKTPWPDGWLIPLLLKAGMLRDDDIRTLLDSGAPTVWAGCLKENIADAEVLLATIARATHLPVAALEHIEPDTRSMLTADFCREHRVAPLRTHGRILEVATDDATSSHLEAHAAFASGRRVRVFLTSPNKLDQLLDKLYPRQEAIASLIAELRPSDGEVLRRAPGASLSGNENIPLVKLVDALIAQAIRGRASDIHLTPDSDGLQVRFRVDGVLHDMQMLPASATRPLVSRLKVMASLDIADRLRPQDGRAEAFIDGRHVDLRISTLPVRHLGETVVIRILDAGATPPVLSGLGLTQSEQYRIERILRGEEGLLLVTGPTGSGKTTTLYSCLRTLKQGGISVVTVEDPVEYKLDGITQVQVNERIGMTFASVLRSMMRQDPDVLLVGEIRDADTVSIAVQASLTGHRVLSTLHTADAASAVTRLLSMGADPTALGQALKGVVAQRLVRKLCTACRVEVDPDNLSAPHAALLGDRVVTKLHRPGGCPACNHTGFYGRLPVAEVLIVTNTIAQAIAGNANAEQIGNLARHAGTRSLWESGLEHVCNGDTSLEELIDTIAPPIVEVEENAPRNEHIFTRAMIDQLIESTKAVVQDASTANERQRRVLVADDDRQVRRVFKVALERAGYHVVEAVDGQATLDLLQRVPVDALLLDINLPKLDGYGVLDAMREGRCPRVPVIVATGHDDPAVADWALELGANDVVTKPIDPRMLSARVDALLEAAAA